MVLPDNVSFEGGWGKTIRRTLRKEDLAEFVELYKSGNRHQRQPTCSAEPEPDKSTGLEGR